VLPLGTRSVQCRSGQADQRILPATSAPPCEGTSKSSVPREGNQPVGAEEAADEGMEAGEPVPPPLGGRSTRAG